MNCLPRRDRTGARQVAARVAGGEWEVFRLEQLCAEILADRNGDPVQAALFRSPSQNLLGGTPPELNRRPPLQGFISCVRLSPVSMQLSRVSLRGHPATPGIPHLILNASLIDQSRLIYWRISMYSLRSGCLKEACPCPRP